MAERSEFWDGVSLGDAVIAPYSSLEFGEVLSSIIAENNLTPWQASLVSLGGYGQTSLYVSGVATPVTVASGYAWVFGHHYQNDGLPALTVAVPTPGANPRLDRIVLRVDYAAQTIRAVRLAGAEAAIPTPPALTQTAATFEVSLAQVYITTGGVITVRDERVGAMGLSKSVLFRDIAERTLEEFFDNFNTNSAAAAAPLGWGSTIVSTGSFTANAGVPSSVGPTSGATANSSATMFRANGATNQFPTELLQAPLLFEWRAAPLNAAADSVTRAEGRFINAAGTNAIIFGVVGPASTASLVLRCVATGTTDFVTNVAIDTSGAFHTFGIWIPSSAGPVVALYDGVAVAACNVAASIPASTVDMRAEFFVGNGATAAERAMNIDWARLVRGTA